jgi:hypothetical protein
VQVVIQCGEETICGECGADVRAKNERGDTVFMPSYSRAGEAAVTGNLSA